jgi:N-acetylglucosaminyldiphosphoundecaprenol N-acetyl-beta-D-mannosaminyltransferase
MDSIEIEGVELKGLRLDLPSEQQIAALALAWDDGGNHQLCFLDTPGFMAARRSSTYSAMIRSADLVLSKSAGLSARAAKAASDILAAGRSLPIRSVHIGARHREYVSFFGTPEQNKELTIRYKPLSVLSSILTVLEERRGSVFLIGGKEDCLARAEANLKATFPALRIVGRSRGDYYGKEAPVLQALQKASPNFILIGSLVKSRELWIPQAMRSTRSGVFLYESSIIETLAGIGRK